MTKNPFRYFKTSREVIQLAVMMYVRFPLSLRNVEDLLHERGVDVCHESIRLWVDRFGPVFAKQIRSRRSTYLRQHTQWQWHLDEVFVKINGAQHYLWRAVDHEGEIFESFVTKKRDKFAALRFLKRAMKHYGPPHTVVTDKLRSYGAAMRNIGNQDRQNTEQYANNPGREFSSTTSTARARNDTFQANVDTSEIRLHRRLILQPFQSSETSRNPESFQVIA